MINEIVSGELDGYDVDATKAQKEESKRLEVLIKNVDTRVSKDISTAKEIM